MIIDCNKDHHFDATGNPPLVSGAQVEQPGVHRFPANALHHRPTADIS